ncbi:MAG: hypothetical protein K5637_08590 [Lachnospiraceae bacterium]|nr:hypothetical protein [Lachnospiraceae bacterium]
MKKAFAVIMLTLAMVLPFAACGSKASSSGSSAAPETQAKTETEAVTETEAPTETKAPETEAPETEAPTETEAPETEAPETKAPETEAVAETEEAAGTEAADFEVGIITGQTYRNEFLGFAVDFPDNWIIADDDTMASVNGAVTEALNDEAAAAALENGKTFFDLYAEREDGYNTVNILYEKIEGVYGVAISEEGYAELSVDSVKKEMEAQGLVDVTCTVDEVVFAGETHAAVVLYGKLYYDTTSYVDLYEKLVCIKNGNYMCLTTIAAYVEDNIDEVMDLFYAIEN